MKNICKMLSLFLVSILVFSISFGINADKKASASEVGKNINDYKAEYKTSSYNNAEQHCFMHVAYGGHKERVSYYEIDGERIDSTFAIQS